MQSVNYSGSQNGIKTNNPQGFENFKKRPFKQNYRGYGVKYEKQQMEKEPTTGIVFRINPPLDKYPKSS